MVDWSTVASLSTAAGTLVLALATFVAVRSANRSARVAEYSMQIGIRPLLMPSRLEDSDQKIMWGDEHWARLSGGGATVEIADDNVYLAMSLRNSGSGIAVIHGWHLGLHDLHDPHPHADPEEFRPQTRDLYVPGGDVGFWQAAIRESRRSRVRRPGRGHSVPTRVHDRVAVHRSRGRPAHDRHVHARVDGRVSAGCARWLDTGTWTGRILADDHGSLEPSSDRRRSKRRRSASSCTSASARR